MKSMIHQFYLVIVGALLAFARWALEPFLPHLYTLSGTRFAVVTVKSTVLTNRDALPSVINKAFLDGARVRHKRGVVTVTNGDSVASTYRFGTIKSNDLVKQIVIDCGACGAGCQFNVGLYDTTGNGGAVVSVSLFATALDVSAALRAVDITRQSGTITVANMEKRVWELLGLAADPMKEYDVCATILNAAAGATVQAALGIEVVGAD